MKKAVGLILCLLLASIAQAQQQCQSQSGIWTVGSSNIALSSANFGSGAGGAFTIIGIVVQNACTLQGKITFGLQVADSSGSAASHVYNFTLYCSSGCGTSGAKYAESGELAGNSTVMTTVSTGSTVNSITRPPGCSAYPCTLPAGTYAVAIATNCTNGASCAQVAGNNALGLFEMFFSNTQTGYTVGGSPAFPATLSGTPITISPVSFNSNPAPSIMFW